MVFPGGLDSKESSCTPEDTGSIPHREDPLEKEMANHSFVLAWRIPWAEMPNAWQATVHGVTKSQTQLSD